MGLKEPYTGQINLISGEIAEDLTYYFAASEQIPSSVALGVLMNENNTVRQAGGFIIQLMPDTSEEVISALEAKVSRVKPVTAMLNEGMEPYDILSYLLGDMGLVMNDKTECGYHCSCSYERVEKALISVGRKELASLIEEGKPVELCCQFCNKKYEFGTDKLLSLIHI